MRLWRLSAYAASWEVRFAEQVQLCVRREVAPSLEEAASLLRPVAQASVRGAMAGQDWPLELTDVSVVAQPQLGLAVSAPTLRDRLLVHLGHLQARPVADDALAGVELLFVALDHDPLALVEAALRAGVPHVVLVPGPGRDPAAAEQVLLESGVAATVLRRCLTAAEVLPLAARGGEGRIAVLAEFDLTRSSTFVLSRPDDHVGRTYRLTGPEAVTLEEFAARIPSPPVLDPAPPADPELLEAIAAGTFSEVTDDVRRIGRWAPRELERAFEVF